MPGAQHEGQSGRDDRRRGRTSYREPEIGASWLELVPFGEFALLVAEFLGQRLAQRPSSRLARNREQATFTRPVVLPPRVVENGVKADPLDRQPTIQRCTYLGPDIVQPRGTRASLSAGLGKVKRPTIPRVDVGQDILQRLVFVMAQRNGAAIHAPLVVRIEVEPCDIEIIGPAT